MKGRKRKSSSPKGKGEYSRTNRRETREREDQTRGSNSWDNDVSWYTKYPNLAVAAGSFPYPYRPGMSLPIADVNFTYDGTSFVNPNVKKLIPGVMALEWLPSLGQSATATDPASVMAKEIYAKVRKAYAGALNADAPDFVIYLLALDGIFSYIAGLKRIYRILTAWSPDNYALPDVLLSALGIKPEDAVELRRNKTQLWQNINTLVLQSRKFTCPAVMDYFNRHYWMNDNVYTDAPTINSQFYVFQMNGVYKYATLNMPNGDPAGGLQMVRTPWNWDGRGNNPYNVTCDSLYKFGLDLIDALVAWDEAYEINGYLSRAFEGAPNFIVDELPIEQPFNPVYSEEVLTQIENSRTVPCAGSILYQNSNAYDGFNITQDVLTNAIIADPRYTYKFDSYGEVSGQGYKVKPWLSARTDQPNVANNIIASRLQSYVKSIEGTTIHVQCASEIAMQWKLYDQTAISNAYITEIPQTPVVVQKKTIDSSTGNVTVKENGVAARIYFTEDVQAFDWHPFIFIITAAYSNMGAGPSTNWTTRIAGDVHNITVVSFQDIVNLHTICLYSELNSFSV